MRVCETWKDVPNWPYEVSDMGRVRRAVPPTRGRSCAGFELKPRLLCGRGKTPYARVILRDGSRRWSVFVHRLVLIVFVCEAPSPKHQCNHIDGDKLNNTLPNLEWVTCAENQRHAKRIGLRPLTTNNARITVADVLTIRSRRAAGEMAVSLADEYGLDRSSIDNIASRRTWRHVA